MEDPVGLGAGDPNLDRYIQNNPLDATDPSGLEEEKPNVPQVNPLDRKVLLYNYGAFLWPVLWQMSTPSSKKGGWLVQHVVRTYEVQGILSVRRNFFKNLDYYEAWRVPPNSTVTANVRLDKKVIATRVTNYIKNQASLEFFPKQQKEMIKEILSNSFDDMFDQLQTGGPNSKGKITITGTVFYIDDLEKAPKGLRKGVVPNAGPLYSMYAVHPSTGKKVSQKSIKALMALPRSKSITHKIVVSWDGTDPNLRMTKVVEKTP
jgi:hypothetical protein